MPHSDDFGSEDDDTAFLAAATQIEASQHGAFEPSPRPTKRRRIRRGPRQIDGASSDDLEWSETDDEGHSPAKETSQYFQSTADPGQAIQDPDDMPEADPDYYFPGELGEDNQQAKKSKYKIHIPKANGKLQDLVFTQTQHGLDSSPSRIRGAVWKKPPRPPPVPAFNAATSGANRPQMNGMTVPPKMNGIRAYMTGGDGQPSAPGVAQRIDLTDGDEEIAARLQAQEDMLAEQRRAISMSKLPHGQKPSFGAVEELEDLPSDAFSSSSPEKSPNKEVIEISSQITASQAVARGLRGPQTGLKQMTIFGQAATQDLSTSQAAKKKHAWPLKSRDEPPTHHKLDDKAMETWVYPTNLGTIRDYQYNIVSRSLYHNTLVALPTGLGKTFIAATVMLNYYRWTTDAHVVFMAPTKPLIAQQMEACYNIVGIQRRDTVLMTGETTPAVRADEWLEKRVFFMTPQTVINDLKTGICDPKKIVLVVVDEAHKATGSYAYTEVTAFLRRFNPSFRVLALTATPGSTVEAVQAVVDNLGIARVELRTEQSLDIRQYTHEKHTETEIFDYSDEQAMIMDLFAKALRPVMEKLCSQNAYWSRDPMALTAYGLTTSRQKWMGSDAGRKAPMSVKGMINSIFTVLAQLAHYIGLLKNHGIVPFYSGVLDFNKNVETGQTKGKYATQISQDENCVKMMSFIRGWTNNPDFIGHPKLQYLRQVVLDHFLNAGEGLMRDARPGEKVPPSATRVMVFASYRDSTEEICRVLKRNEPMIRPHVFVGQAASKGSEGMDQKKQNAVIQDFKSGKYNTLVATSIGEEGLDIGDVDLIVCYDASASPIRMLQRIGRTGRKRVGRVVLLLMKGKEENDYAKAQDNYTYIQKTIADTSKYTYRDDQSPRIVPKEVHPVVDRRIIDIPPENSQPIDLNERKRKASGRTKKKPAKKFHMPDGVRTGFTKASKLGDSDDNGESEVDEQPALRKKATTKKRTPAKTRKAPASPEPEPAQVPFLGDVLLNDMQERELERKYAIAADGDEDAVIRAPDASRFPQTFRHPSVTKYIRHGRASATVAKALRAVHEVNDDKVADMRDTLHHSDLEDDDATRARLVSPQTDVDDSDNALPDLPVPARITKPKPRNRAKKKPLQRATSHGSTAVEGDESEPEPTPADMRIGTQGIDLGSRDTDGEDEEEEPDSELEDFVVKSDQPIDTLSSSLPASQEATPRPVKSKGRLMPRAGRSVALISSDDESSDLDAQVGARSDISVDSNGDDGVHNKENSGRVARSRTKRIVGDSDSDE